DVLFIYDKPFVGYLKTKSFNARDAIDEIWEEIIFSLKSSLIFLRMQNDTSFDIKQLLVEIEALRAVQDFKAIQSIVKLKNAFDDNSSVFMPSSKDIDLILKQINKNPMIDLC